MNTLEKDAIYQHGCFLFEWGKETKSKVVAEGLVTLSPEYAKGWLLLSTLYSANKERALSYALQAYRLAAHDPEIILHYCQLEIVAGDPKKARPILETLALGQREYWSVRARLMLNRL